MRGMLYETFDGRLHTGGQELIARWRGDERTLLWFDLGEEPADEAGRVLREEFGLHPLAVQDALRERHPPKLEDFQDYTFLLLRGLSAASTDTDFSTIQLALFVGGAFGLRHSADSPAPTTLARGGRTPAGWRRSAALALRLSRIMADRWLGILLARASAG
jgi:magnesium transporter